MQQQTLWAEAISLRRLALPANRTDEEKPRAMAGLKLIGVDSMMKGRTGLRPGPQGWSQVPLWIATRGLPAEMRMTLCRVPAGHSTLPSGHALFADRRAGVAENDVV